ncbi:MULTISPECIES: hypothetical protein [unclassified Ensifer]|nr:MULTISPECIES: hypothetical protein [unclassified Ensifer]
MRVRALGHDPRHKAVTGRDLKAAFSMAAIGAVLVAVTIALGG